MTYSLIWKDDEYEYGYGRNRNNQYILYRYGKDKKLPKQQIIKCDSDIRNAEMTFRISGSKKIINCKIEQIIQIINNVKNKRLYQNLIQKIGILDNKDIEKFENMLLNKNILFNIKYPYLYKNNYIYDEFGEHYDVARYINKIYIEYKINNNIYNSKLSKFIHNHNNNIYFITLK
jgi:hypothetical protein